MGKRGFGALNIIFTIFLLVIISLVVIALLVKYVNKPDQINEQGYFDSLLFTKKLIECENKCSLIEESDEDSYLAYCTAFFSFDANSNSMLNEPFEYGRFVFCEGTIPCYVIYNCEKLKKDCKKVICKSRPDLYYSYFYDAEAGKKCNLPQGKNNWIIQFKNNLRCE